MTLAGLLLGIINIAIAIAVLVLLGYIIMWIMNALGWPIPGQIAKIYMLIVGLIAIYMLASLLLGLPLPFRVVHPL